MVNIDRIFTSHEEEAGWKVRVNERTGHIFANNIRQAIKADPNAPGTALPEMHQQAAEEATNIADAGLTIKPKKPVNPA